VAVQTVPDAWISFRKPPRELALAWGAGLGVGIVTAGTAYAFYAHAGGPTVPGVAVIPFSMAVVAALYVALARRRMVRASDWLALGYTAAILLSLAALTVQQALHEFYLELNATVW
jgi:FtsH-binding integral membrane protein